MECGKRVETSEGALNAPQPPFADMVWIPARTFRMGSDRHYPEERPAHLVSVDGFWIDRAPVTNARFARFVEATRHVTFAETVPDPAQYPDALPEMLYAGSLVFQRPPGPVDLNAFTNWWTYLRDADWRHPRGAATSIDGLEQHPVVHVTFGDAEAFAAWEGKSRLLKLSGNSPHEVGSRERLTHGATHSCPAIVIWLTRGRVNSPGRTSHATDTKVRRRSAPFPRTATDSTT